MGRHPELRKSLELRQRLFDTLALPGSEYGRIVWAFPWIYPSERSPVDGGCGSQAADVFRFWTPGSEPGMAVAGD